MFRHGERAPVYDLSYFNICKDGFPEGKGHLTRVWDYFIYININKTNLKFVLLTRF